MNYIPSASSTSSAPFFVGVMEEDQNHMKEIQYPTASTHTSSTTTIPPVPPPPPPPQKKKRNLPGTPNPDAEIIALSPKSLMATNRFICEVCNKGFQREQNLQLHRRGHNLPWKLKQNKNTKDDMAVKRKVYLCPEPTCVHHHPSRPLGDLTGIKKHYSRKHGEKKYKCDKCSKKYAVQSDWKAHCKTCGTREYRCDCGTLFSRRDSFITHRAFCEALAHEISGSCRHPPSLSTISSHLFGSINPPINLALSDHHLHHNPPPNKYQHLLLRDSNINPPPSHQWSLIPPDSAQQELPPHHLYQEHHNSPMPNKSFHDLMHHLQTNNINNSPPNLFNIDFFPPTNTNIGNNNNNNSNNMSSSSFMFNDFSNGSGGQGMSLLCNDHVGSSFSSIYDSQHSATPHMSATALLQKAAQIGSTTSSNGGSLSRMDNEISQIQAAGLMESFANAGSCIYSTTDEDDMNGYCGLSESIGMEMNIKKFGDDRMTTLDFLGVGGGGGGRMLRNGGFSDQSIISTSFHPKIDSFIDQTHPPFGGAPN